MRGNLVRLVQFDAVSLRKQGIDTWIELKHGYYALTLYIKHISQLSRDIFACARGNSSYVIFDSNLHRYFSACTVTKNGGCMGRVRLKQSHKTGPYVFYRGPTCIWGEVIAWHFMPDLVSAMYTYKYRVRYRHCAEMVQLKSLIRAPLLAGAGKEYPTKLCF